MKDVELTLRNGPDALAEFGETLGAAGVSLEGGGVFGTTAHFLVADGAAARAALESAGLGPVKVSDVVMLRLDQAEPGQLGAAARRLADAGVNLLVQYSDHEGRLVLVVDPAQRALAEEVAAGW